MIEYFREKISHSMDMLGIKKYLSRRYFDYLLIVISIFLALYLNWDIISVAIFAFVIWQILYPLPRLTLAKISLLSIAFLPVLFIFKKEDEAGKLAIFVFCILFLALIMTILEYFNQGESGA